MSIFDRFRRRAVIIRRDAIAASILKQSIEEVYRTQPALRACVSFLAENAGSLPLKCYERKSDTDRPRVSEGVVPALLTRPNRWEALQDVLVGVFSDYLLYGWALLYVIPSKDMASGWEMVRIPIPWIQNKETIDGFSISQYTVKNPNTTSRPVDLSADDCIRIASYDPQGQVLACSPVEALKQVLAEQISAWDFRNATWKNGGKIGGAYLKRPLGADWSKEAKERFVESWKNKFSGEGDDTGGTPLLEDGMELVSMQFNAREAEWAEATKLARGDVAAVYHVNPALIWHDQSMTYASAKDNARALYADTLAPILSKVESSLNTFLLPKIAAPEKEYLEFDLSAKLQGSFEEQAQVLQSAVGRPYILPNEARARMNLPSIEGGDELAMPLNMTTGTSGSDVQENGELAGVMHLKVAGPTEGRRPVKENAEVHILSKASTSAERDISEVLDSFYKRQERTIANQLASMDPDDIVLDGYMDWWDKDRWVRELSTDLQKASRHPAYDAANRVLDMLCGDHDGYDLSNLDTDVENLCKFRADDIVQSTLDRLTNDLRDLESLTPESIRSCVRESYAKLQDGRVERNSQSMATAIANAGTHGGAKASGYKCTKTWHSFPGARRSHAHMNGETVQLDKRFSNGARWPGDTNLPAEETCNCRCRLEITKTGKHKDDFKKTVLEKVDKNEVVPPDYSANPRESYGVFIKPGDYSEANIIHSGKKEWRDLFAHDTLSEYGFHVKALAANAPDGFSNIDVMLNNVLWEIKSPTGLFEQNNFTFVDDAMKKARRQFEKQYDPNTNSYLDYKDRKRVVLNLYYKDGSTFDAIEEPLKERMRARKIDDVMVIDRDGTVTLLEKQ